MNKFIRILLIILLPNIITACVTQQYVDDDKSPVVQTDATNNEIAMTRISLGIGYLNIGNTKQAKFNLEKAKRFAPKLVQVHTAFAHYYDSVGEPELAIASYEEALSLKSNDADTLNNYGVFLCRQGRLDDAEKQFLKAINVPSYILVSESYENLALCQLKENKFEKAQEYLEKSITHSPSRASALQQMAILQYAKQEYQQAEIFIKRYEKSTRRFSANALALAFKINEKQRKIKVAKNYASLLLKMFPNSYEAKQYLLNGLVEIDADKLADAYRSYKSTKSKKRVVVLKPKQDRNFPKTPPIKAPKKVDNDVSKPVKKAVLITDNQVEKSISPELSVTEKFLIKSKEQATKIVAEKKSELNDKDPVLTKTTLASASEGQNKSSNKQTMMTLPIHVVSKGDSLFNISKQYNIKMNKLLKWNKLSKNKIIKIGDIIYLANPRKAMLK